MEISILVGSFLSVVLIVSERTVEDNTARIIVPIVPGPGIGIVGRPVSASTVSNSAFGKLL
jgi:hypothetical protein